jgi:hypothetical protein
LAGHPAVNFLRLPGIRHFDGSDREIVVGELKGFGVCRKDANDCKREKSEKCFHNLELLGAVNATPHLPARRYAGRLGIYGLGEPLLRSDISQLNSPPVTHTESRLQQVFVRLCEKAGQRAPFPSLKINPPLPAWEAQYFLLGLEENLFALDEEGQIHSDLIAGPEKGARLTFPIFSQEHQPRLIREYICQLAALSFLILERGWLRGQVILELGRPEHRSTAHGVDLLVRSNGDRTDIWIEVKRSAVELQKLITDLRACSRRGPHAPGDCGFPQNHPRYEFCIFYKPTYLWAVASDAEGCFRINYEQSSIEFEQLGSLPPRSLIERT